MILPQPRDPRFITLRRGGTLSDPDHHLLALWAVACARRALPRFAAAAPEDDRPARALELAEAWARGEVPMKACHGAAFAANAAGKGLPDAARFAALAAGQAVAVSHVAAHQLGAAAYAIRSAMAAAPKAEQEALRAAEVAWQRAQLPEGIRALVLEDMGLRNAICWGVFDA